MLLKELLEEEYNRGKAAGLAEVRAEARAKGRAEGMAEGMADSILQFLARHIDISEEVKSKIGAITDIDKLDELFDTLLDVNSEEEARDFIRNL